MQLFAILGFLAAFATMTGTVVAGYDWDIDRSMLLAFRVAGDPSRLLGPAWLPETARNLTAVGSVPVLIAVLVVATGALLLSGKTPAALRLLLAAAGGLVLLNLIKWGIARPRPDVVTPLGEVFTSSFPSGHAFLSATIYLTLAAIAGRMACSRQLAIFLVAASLVLTFVAGLSRIYLGLHYPRDVLAGWCLGAAWVLCCGLIVGRLSRKLSAAAAGAER
jgi:undecaprenyl-diphosphatase